MNTLGLPRPPGPQVSRRRRIATLLCLILSICAVPALAADNDYLPYNTAWNGLSGLDAMARAGFDPAASVSLWENMAAAGGGQPPEFMSTHPSHGSRIAGLEGRMTEARGLYIEARDAGRDPNCNTPPGR